MRIKIGLSTNSINNAIKQIESYKNSLNNKCYLLVEELSNFGIQIANYNTVSSLVFFGKEIHNEQDGCRAIVYGEDIGTIIETWVGVGGEIREAEVSPLLMAEFGSGFKAKNPLNVQGVGQGTFPGQTHAFDKNGWWWMDLDGEWHHSYGIEPTQPMYKASILMKTQVVETARRIFRS